MHFLGPTLNAGTLQTAADILASAGLLACLQTLQSTYPSSYFLTAVYGLQAEFEKVFGPPIHGHSVSTESPAKGPSTPQPSAEAICSNANTPLLPTDTLNPPTMYSSTTDTTDPSTFNARASWLAGKAVHGNAFLSYTKIRHTGWLVPAVVFNSDFTLEVFWPWVHGLLPEVEYVNKASSALVSRLPTVFRWAWIRHTVAHL